MFFFLLGNMGQPVSYDEHAINTLRVNDVHEKRCRETY